MYDWVENGRINMKKVAYYATIRNISPASEEEVKRIVDPLVILLKDFSPLKRMLKGVEKEEGKISVYHEAPPVDEPVRSICNDIVEKCSELYRKHLILSF